MSQKKYEKFVKPRLLEIKAWTRNGLSEKEIAERLNVSYASFRTYKKNSPSLELCLKENKEVVDIKVENALLKRALGYKYIEVIRELKIDPKTGKERLAVTKTVTKEVLPDIGAQRFWLSNRQSNTWAENPQSLEIKKEELELRKREIELKEW